MQTYGPPVTLQNANSAVATFAATAGGAYGFQVVAADGHEGYAYALGEVNVPANRAPTGVNPMSAVNWVLPGTTVPLTATATDPDGDPIAFAWSIGSQPAGGDGVLATASGVTNTFRATRSGRYGIVLAASDGRGGLTTAVRNLTFDTDPTVNAGPDRTVRPGDLVTLAASAHDPDGDPLTYAWQQFRGPAVALDTPASLSASFVAPLAGTYGFSFSATDPSGAIAQDSILLTATVPQQADLVAAAVAAASGRVEVGQPLPVTGSVRNSGTIPCAGRTRRTPSSNPPRQTTRPSPSCRSRSRPAPSTRPRRQPRWPSRPARPCSPPARSP